MNSTIVNVLNIPGVTPFPHLLDPLIIANGKTVDEIYFFNRTLADERMSFVIIRSEFAVGGAEVVDVVERRG